MGPGVAFPQRTHAHASTRSRGAPLLPSSQPSGRSGKSQAEAWEESLGAFPVGVPESRFRHDDKWGGLSAGALPEPLVQW